MNGIYSIADAKPASLGLSAYRSYTEKIASRHPRLKKLIKAVGPPRYKIPIWRSVDSAVLYAVIGQMLSSQAACSIIKKLLEKFGSAQAVITWAGTTAFRLGALQGISQRKRRALKEWSNYLGKEGDVWRRWPAMTLDEYRGQIMNIWGFGRWAADMIAIFYLGRMDVWPDTDKGIDKISKLVFGKSAKQSRGYVKGYETIAALYFWECANQKLVAQFDQ